VHKHDAWRIFRWEDAMDQIGKTLDLIKIKLNQYFNNIHRENEEWTIVSNIVKQDGSLYENAKDKVVIFLTNIQHETIVSTYNKNMPVNDQRFAIVAPPIYINLYVLFYANYYDGNYRDGLMMLSGTISFFQQNPTFTQANLPGLESNIDKLTFEMVNMDLTERSYLYGLIGSKCLPSVLYKVRMIPFISNELQGQAPAVQGLQDQAEPLDDVDKQELDNQNG